MPNGNQELLIGPAQPLERDALIFALIGASAVGKSASAKRLCDTGVVEATPTWTTRLPRPGELDTAHDHHFVSDAMFGIQSKKDVFMDERALYGARYGLPFPAKPPAGIEALVVLKPVFILALLKCFPRARIYQIEASQLIVPERMKERGQSQADIAERLQHHKAETAAASRVAHVRFDNNGPFELTFQRILAQIRTDREAYDNNLLKAA